jgi:Fe-S-cluster containining protein
MELLTVNDCRQCGACCASRDDAPLFVTLTVADTARLQASEFREGQKLRTKRLGVRCVCAALGGELGVHVSCSIYEARPMVCRMVQPNSRDCLAARACAGLV